MSFNRPTAQPGEKVRLTMGSNGNSHCGYNVINRQAYLNTQQENLSLEKITRRLEAFVLPTDQYVSTV